MRVRLSRGRWQVTTVLVALATVAGLASVVAGVSGVSAAEPEPVDVELDKRAEGSERVAVGDTVEFTLTLVNAADAAATGVVVEDRLPDGLAVVSALPSLGDYEASTGRWEVAELSSGAVASLTLVTEVRGSSGTLVNAAEVVALDQPDVDSTPANGDLDEDDLDRVTLRPVRPELDVDLTSDPDDEVGAGRTLAYELLVRSTGAVSARDVVVSLPAPDGARYVAGSARVDGREPDDAAENPFAAAEGVGDLEPDETVEVRLEVRVDEDPPDTLEAVATASARGVSAVRTTRRTDVVAEAGGAADEPQRDGSLPRTGIELAGGDGPPLAAVLLGGGLALVGLAHRLDKRRRLAVIADARRRNAAAWAREARMGGSVPLR